MGVAAIAYHQNMGNGRLKKLHNNNILTAMLVQIILYILDTLQYLSKFSLVFFME
jgi:hypothetical protein